MKFIIKKYRMITIWLSLFILSAAFVVGSDRPSRGVCVPAAFFACSLLYLLGSVRAWTKEHVTTALVELLLAVCMLTGTVLTLLQQGGLL